MVHKPGTSLFRSVSGIVTHLSNFGDIPHTRYLASQYILNRVSTELGNLIQDRAVKLAYKNHRQIFYLNDILIACDEFDLKQLFREKRLMGKQQQNASAFSNPRAPLLPTPPSAPYNRQQNKQKSNTNRKKTYYETLIKAMKLAHRLRPQSRCPVRQ